MTLAATMLLGYAGGKVLDYATGAIFSDDEETQASEQPEEKENISTADNIELSVAGDDVEVAKSDEVVMNYDEAANSYVQPQEAVLDLQA